MKIIHTTLTLLLALFARTATAADPYLWLEDIHGARSINWVHGQNARTFKRFDNDPLYKSLHANALSVLESPSRVPEVQEMGGYIYNLWQDRDHPRGIYRRASIASFVSGNPRWQTVMDMDALSKAEGRRWAFGGMTCLPPADIHCMVRLRPGGRDATQMREFNTDTLRFVKHGFFVPVSKGGVSWINPDTLYIGTNFGKGSMTHSGYPRTVHVWHRSKRLADARLLFETGPDAVSAYALRVRTSNGDIDLVSDNITFWKSHYFQVIAGKLARLELPDTAKVEGGYGGRLVISLKADWKRGDAIYPSGSVLLADPDSLRAAGGPVQMLVRPARGEVVESVEPTVAGVLVTMLDDVRGRLYRYTLSGGKVQREPIPFPDNGALGIMTSRQHAGDAVIEYQSFLTPPTLYYLPAGSTRPQVVASQAATFDADGFAVHQYWTTSADGTRIPYFVVGRKHMKLDGKNPVWMFSYGGFEISLTPSYSGSYEDLKGAYGKLWLDRGGVFVLANIRGGGEFGPSWHTQALKAGHIKAFEDFEAVARDLFARRITSPSHLGIEGRSNGGLLVASTMIRHPELYGAVVCGSPLLDMKRYTRLGAGASWVAEYGNPDNPADWAYIKRYSPYQNVKPGGHYPPVFFYSSTLDDRVDPAHARKMVAKMESMGDDVYYYENTEGGHHGSVTPEELARRIALTYTFLWEHLRQGRRQGAGR